MLAKFFSEVSGVIFEGKFYKFYNGELETSNEKLVKKLIDNNFKHKIISSEQISIAEMTMPEEPKEEIKKYSLFDLQFKTKLDLKKIAESHDLKLSVNDTKDEIIEKLKGAGVIDEHNRSN